MLTCKQFTFLLFMERKMMCIKFSKTNRFYKILSDIDYDTIIIIYIYLKSVQVVYLQKIVTQGRTTKNKNYLYFEFLIMIEHRTFLIMIEHSLYIQV